jgi:cell division protein DivIC
MAKTKRRKKESNVAKMVWIIVIIFAIFILSDALKKIYNMFVLKQQADLVEAQLQELKDENASLVSTKEKLEDPDYIQTYARGEYMFSKGDEKVFYLPSE